MTYEIKVLGSDGLGIPDAKIMTLEGSLIGITDVTGYVIGEFPSVVKVGTFITIPQVVTLNPGLNIVRLEDKIFQLPEAVVTAEKDPGVSLLHWLYIFIFIYILYNLNK